MKSIATRYLMAAGASAVVALAGPSPGLQAAEYFKGKTITFLVGFSAGGGVDLGARTFARHLGGHIPGNPTVVVKNMAGGSSMKAHNYVFEAARGDRETIFYGPWFPVSQILNVPGVRFKYQDFALVSAFSTGGYVMYARTDIVPGGLSKGADIVRAGDVRFSGQNPFNFFDLVGTLSLEIFGVNYKYVTGYRGSSKIRAAVMKNETNVAVDSSTGYNSVVRRTMVEPGTVRPLWTFPSKSPSGDWVDNMVLPEIPSIIEVHKEAKGMAPAGEKWKVLDLVLSLYGTFSQVVLGPPSLNQTALADLRKGFDAMMADAALKADFNKRFRYEPTPAPRDAAHAIMKSLGSIEAGTLASLKAHVAAGRKVRR